MRRREFIGLLSGAAAVLPLGARAQNTALPVVGFLQSASPGGYDPFVSAFRAGLVEMGYSEDRNVRIEFRWAEGDYDRLPVLAAELARKPVTVIFAGGETATLAAKSATATIPIVFTAGADPVRGGVVASINRPAANVTGIYIYTTDLMAKRLELLREVMPSVNVVGVLLNPHNGTAGSITAALESAASVQGVRLLILKAGNESEIDAAFATLAQDQVSALLVAADPFYNSKRELIVGLAGRYRMSAIFEWREFAAAGGLMSYGSNLARAYREAGVYVGRILKGETPATLPVMQQTTVELIINLKTAKNLGVSIPLPLLGRADEVIE